MSVPEIRLGYLISCYPAISHTFILREVLALRRQGLQLRVASINSADRPLAALTQDEREEAQQTYYIKQAGAAAALTTGLRFLFQRPLATMWALAYTFWLGGVDLRRLMYALFYFAEALLVSQWMRRQELEHLHVHFATPASTVGLIVTRLVPVTLSITVHGPDEFYDVPGYQLAEKIRQSLFLCAIGRFARSQLMKISAPCDWPKFEVSPLGIDPEVFQSRSGAPRSKGAPVEVLCVGRLVPAKGQHVLVAAVARLHQAGKHVRLRLVGDGPDRASLAAEVERRGLQEVVVLEGAIDQDRIRELYAQADLFVLPSFAEGIPVVLMEAMAMEIPCITTHITGIPELIEHGRHGWLIPPSDEEALAQAIDHLAGDSTLCRKLGRAGRQKVMEHYDLQTNTKRLAGIFARRLRGAA